MRSSSQEPRVFRRNDRDCGGGDDASLLGGVAVDDEARSGSGASDSPERHPWLPRPRSPSHCARRDARAGAERCRPRLPSRGWNAASSTGVGKGYSPPRAGRPSQLEHLILAAEREALTRDRKTGAATEIGERRPREVVAMLVEDVPEACRFGPSIRSSGVSITVTAAPHVSAIARSSGEKRPDRPDVLDDMPADDDVEVARDLGSPRRSGRRTGPATEPRSRPSVRRCRSRRRSAPPARR